MFEVQKVALRKQEWNENSIIKKNTNNINIFQILKR